MAVKLLMTWDIQAGQEQDYFEFVIREFIPGIQRLGLETSDAWFTMYGDQPQIQVGATSDTQSDIEDVLKSSEWNSLVERLMEFVENFKYKIVNARRGFQM